MTAAMFEPSFPAGGAAVYAWAFGQGVLVDLTPCVYPLIPITVAVFGAKGVSRGRALFLASAYVLGMAALYTALGVLVALSGGQFGAWLANPWVVIPIATLLLALAASMFGAFDLQLPAGLQTRLNAVGGAGPVGAFLMGLVSGFISAPCTGPVLLSLLAYIAKASAEGSSVLYGASLLFVYALGMGTLFFAVALGASLFRPGPWMEYIKSFFGVALIVMALWFLAPVYPALGELVLDPTWGLWLGLGLVAVAFMLGAIHLSFYGPPSEKLRKGVAVAIAVFGAQLAVNNILYVPPADWHEVQTLDELEATLARAEAESKPVLIDFSATWCLPCKELDVQTFHHADVEPLLAERFHLVKIDVTDPNDDQMLMQSGFRSGTLPSVLIYPSSGFDAGAMMSALRGGGEAPEPSAHFKTFVDAEAFLDQIREIR
jgi:thioredoxin:protein disulfide reductase